MAWFLDDPTRFARERRAFEELAAEGGLIHTWRIAADDALLVDVDFQIHGVMRHGVLRYPASFPYALPYIRPRNPAERWSHHQFGAGGSLCLEYRADNWNPDATGADMMRSAFKLLATENHPLASAEVLSVHRQSAGQRLRAFPERLVLTPDAVSMMSGWLAGTSASCNVIKILRETTHTHFIVGLRVGDVESVVADVPGKLSAMDGPCGLPITGRVYRANTWSGHQYLETVDDLAAALGDRGFDPETLDDLAATPGGTTLVVLVGDASDACRAYAVDAHAPTALQPMGIVHSGVSASRLPQDAAALAATRAAVVGLGSLGSKVAVSLARSGVRRFVLVDDDVLLGENIARHDLDWASVGEHKAVAVAAKLQRIAPGVEVAVHIENIDGQQSPAGAANILDDLAMCDLIFDATADPHVFLRLAGVARMSKTAFVWAEVYAGGLAGLIARARPGVDPNPFAVRDGLIHYYAGLPEAPFKMAVDYDDTSDAPVVAYDSVVAFIAAAATHLMLDTALERDPSVFPFPAYRFGLRAGWDFSGPFEAVPIGIEGAGWDFPITEVNLDDAKATTAAIGALLKDRDASHPTAS